MSMFPTQKYYEGGLNSTCDVFARSYAHESRLQKKDELLSEINRCQDELWTIISRNSSAKKNYDHRGACPSHHKTAMKVADQDLFTRSNSPVPTVRVKRSYTSSSSERPVKIDTAVHNRLFNQRPNDLPKLVLPPPPKTEERTYYTSDSYNIPNYAPQPTMAFHAQRMETYITDLHSPTIQETAIQSQNPSFDHLPPPPPWMLDQNEGLSFEKQVSKASYKTSNPTITKPNSGTSLFQELQSKLLDRGGPKE